MRERSIREAARRILPPTLRKPLGNVAGYLYHAWIQPMQGFFFDLSGNIFKADECVFEIPRNLTTRTCRSGFWSGDYEEDERTLIKQFVRADDRVLELGACIGVVSCVTNRLLADKSKHLVVEGNPKLIQWIKHNRDLNHAGFTVEHCAVSSKPEVTFYLHPQFIVGGTLERKSSLPVQVRGRNLRDLDRQFGPFNVMIMDIEGSELEALSACEDLLSNYRLVIIELHEWAIGEQGVARCRDLFQRAGLRKVAQRGGTDAWMR